MKNSGPASFLVFDARHVHGYATRSTLPYRPQRLRNLYCSKLAHGRTVLIGDALHAMTASLGQGVNAALGERCQ